MSAKASGFWSDSVYLSKDATYDFSDTFVTSQYHFSPLDPGASSTIDTTASLPSVAAGDYYLLFIADGNHSVSESDETNNVRALPITLTVPNVDLTITALQAPSSVKAGAGVNASWTIENQGTDPTTASYWYDYIYLSTDNKYDPFDSYVSSVYVDNSTPLAAGGSRTLDKTVFLPTAVAGDYFLIVVTNDSTNYQAETTKDNNANAVAITVTPADVDLVVNDATAPGTAAIGAIDVSWTVKNLGTDPAKGFWYDYVYLSADDKYDFADSYVTSSYSSPLDGGSSYTRTLSASLPSVAAGDYYLLFVTDSNHNITETDETNNVRALPITLTLPKVNLAVTAANAPATAQAGHRPPSRGP